MESLPDFRTLSDTDLDELIEKLTKQEDKISFDRRILQGNIDMLRAERTARKKAGSLAPVHVEQLVGVLSRKSPPDGWSR